MYLGLLFFLVNNNDSNCCYKQHVPPLLRVHVYIFNFFSCPCKPVFCIAPTFTIISYEAFKAQMRRDDPTKRLGPANYMIAATESGLITLVLTNPIYVIKTRLCLQFGAQDFSEEKRYR